MTSPSKNVFEAVKEHLKIKELYEDLTNHTVGRGGSSLSVRCPLPDHEDKNPSATLNVQEDTWRCHRCDVGGSVIDLAMRVHDMEPAEAAEWLAAEYQVPYEEMDEEEIEEHEKRRSRRERYFSELEEFINRTHQDLTDEQRDHLRDRGLSNETIDDMKIGHCRESAGSATYRKISAFSAHDNYLPSGRIIIPVYRFETPIYWVGYDPDAGDDDPRYLYPHNADDDPWLERPLWGRETVETDDPFYITEGVFDHLSLWEAGLPSICLFGIHPSQKQRQQLERLMGDRRESARIAFDNDPGDDNPGMEAARDLAKDLWPRPVEILELPPGQDINDLWVQDSSRGSLEEALERANQGNPVDVLLDEFSGLSGREKVQRAQDVYPLLAQLNEDQKGFYVNELYDVLDATVRKSVLRDRVDQAQETVTTEGPDQYFQGNRFVAARLAQDILEGTPYLFVGEQLYRYEDGVYRGDGDSVLRRQVQDHLQDRWTSHCFREVQTYVEHKTYQHASVYEPERNIINVQNGMLDITTGELTEHDPKHKSLVQHPVRYDPEAEFPPLDEFVHSIVPEDCVELIWEFAGYCLLRPLELKKVLILKGGGNNGKSALLKACFEKPLGEQHLAHESLQDLGGENRFSTAQLFGKVANINADLEANEVQKTGTLKELTGNDTIRAERKHREPFYFTNHARLLFAANELPVIRDYNQALFNRLLIVDCPNTFTGEEQDPNVVEKVTTQEAKSHWLNRAIQGARRLLDRGQFDVPESVEDEVKKYQLRSNSVAAFIERCTCTEEGSWVVKGDLYRIYRAWCAINGIQAMGKQKFGRLAKKPPCNLEDGRPRLDGTREVAWKDRQITHDVWQQVSGEISQASLTHHQPPIADSTRPQQQMAYQRNGDASDPDGQAASDDGAGDADDPGEMTHPF